MATRLQQDLFERRPGLVAVHRFGGQGKNRLVEAGQNIKSSRTENFNEGVGGGVGGGGGGGGVGGGVAFKVVQARRLKASDGPARGRTFIDASWEWFRHPHRSDEGRPATNIW